jgi:hypothetical protein
LKVLNPLVRSEPSRIKNYRIILWTCTRKYSQPHQIAPTFILQKKQSLFEYVNLNRKRLTDNTSNLASVLASDPAYNICTVLTFVQEILAGMTLV